MTATQQPGNKPPPNVQIKIPIEELRKRKLFVATPMYGGQCLGSYSTSMINLATDCVKMNLHMQYHTIHNESLITRARNYCVDEFLRSDCTNMLFIDADIGFQTKDVLTLLSLQDPFDEKNEYDVIGAVYPKKSISWEKVKDAVDKGIADENPEILAKFVGDLVFNPKLQGNASINIFQPCEIRELGTGFMMIKRSTFEKYDKTFPELMYKPDHARTEHFDGSREIMAYFDCIIDPETKRYLSEDYMFSYNVQKMGGKVWMCPWIELSHTGTYVFHGSMQSLAQIQASPTVDPSKLAKKK